MSEQRIIWVARDKYDMVAITDSLESFERNEDEYHFVAHRAGDYVIEPVARMLGIELEPGEGPVQLIGQPWKRA